MGFYLAHSCRNGLFFLVIYRKNRGPSLTFAKANIPVRFPNDIKKQSVTTNYPLGFLGAQFLVKSVLSYFQDLYQWEAHAKRRSY